MFSSKPAQPVIRTTDPKLLRQKAIAFLDKNYTRVKSSVPYDFYMLEPKSINGMKKIRCEGKDRQRINGQPTKTLCIAQVSYDKLSDGKPYADFEKIIIDDDLNITPVWSRSISVFGNSASDAILGGRKSRRKSSRRQRKSRRHRA